VHSLVASKADLKEEAYRYFKESATIDLYNQSKKVISGGAFLGGIHTAACGALWEMIVRGFAGFERQNGVLTFQPHLPPSWESLSFDLLFKHNRFSIQVTSQQINIKGHSTNPDPIPISVLGQEEFLQAEDTIVFDLTHH
jgi:kojibiose phosphorylase